MNILFVCTGNTCRSQMAEGIAKSLAKNKGLDIDIRSAGIFALDGGNIADNSIESLKNVNIDISQYKSNLVNKDLIKESDIVLTMTKGHKENLIMNFSGIDNKVFLLNEYAYDIDQDVEDPYGGNISIYNKVRDEIYKAIETIFNNIG